jgi:hypothetical protein
VLVSGTTAAITSFLRWRKALKSPKKGPGPPDRHLFYAFPGNSYHFLGQKTISSPQCTGTLAVTCGNASVTGSRRDMRRGCDSCLDNP